MRSSGDTLPAQLVQRERGGCVVRWGLRNTDETEEITTTRTRIEAGYYQWPQILVITINKALLRALPANVVRLSYSVVTHKMTLTMLSNVVFLEHHHSRLSRQPADWSEWQHRHRQGSRFRCRHVAGVRIAIRLHERCWTSCRRRQHQLLVTVVYRGKINDLTLW